LKDISFSNSSLKLLAKNLQSENQPKKYLASHKSAEKFD